MNTPEPTAPHDTAEEGAAPTPFRTRLWRSFTPIQRIFLTGLGGALGVAFAIGLFSLMTHNTAETQQPEPPASSSGVNPGAPAPSHLPSAPSEDPSDVNEPATENFTAPEEQIAIDHKEDPDAAADQAYAFAGRAVRAYFYSDTNETPEQRQERLSVYFVKGDRAITDSPLYVAEGSLSGVTDAVINSYELVEEGAKPTQMKILVSLTWSVAAWAPGAESSAETFGGDNVVMVDIEVVDGVWKASNIERKS